FDPDRRGALWGGILSLRVVDRSISSRRFPVFPLRSVHVGLAHIVHDVYRPGGPGILVPNLPLHRPRLRDASACAGLLHDSVAILYPAAAEQDRNLAGR